MTRSCRSGLMTWFASSAWFVRRDFVAFAIGLVVILLLNLLLLSLSLLLLSSVCYQIYACHSRYRFGCHFAIYCCCLVDVAVLAVGGDGGGAMVIVAALCTGRE